MWWQDPGNIIGLVAGAVVVSLLLFVYAVVRRYRRVGPNQALVISGMGSRYRAPDGTVAVRGFRIVRGGGTFVWPVIEKEDVLSLEIVTVEARVDNVGTSDGKRVSIDGAAQVKICGDDGSIAAAAECLLGKSPEEIQNVVRLVLEDVLRAEARTLRAEEMDRERQELAERVKSQVEKKLGDMGFEVPLLSIRDVRA